MVFQNRKQGGCNELKCLEKNLKFGNYLPATITSNCHRQTSKFLPLSDDRLATIEAKSKKRHDTLHLKLSKMDVDGFN